MTPDVGSPNSYLLTCLKNGEAVLAGEMDVSELGVEATDEKTLVFTLEQPTPYFLSLTDTRVMMPQRQDIVEQYGDTFGARRGKLGLQRSVQTRYLDPQLSAGHDQE